MLTSALRAADATLYRLNMLVLLLASFLPFPTKLVPEFIGEDSPEQTAVVFYGPMLLALDVSLTVFLRYAAEQRRLVKEGSTESSPRGPFAFPERRLKARVLRIEAFPFFSVTVNENTPAAFPGTVRGSRPWAEGRPYEYCQSPPRAPLPLRSGADRRHDACGLRHHPLPRRGPERLVVESFARQRASDSRTAPTTLVVEHHKRCLHCAPGRQARGATR